MESAPYRLVPSSSQPVAPDVLTSSGAPSCDHATPMHLSPWDTQVGQDPASSPQDASFRAPPRRRNPELASTQDTAGTAATESWLDQLFVRSYHNLPAAGGSALVSQRSEMNTTPWRSSLLATHSGLLTFTQGGLTLARTADLNPFQGGSTLKGRSLPLIQGGTTLGSGTRSEIRSQAYLLRLNANSSDKDDLPNPVAHPSRSSHVWLINSHDEPSQDPATSVHTHVSKDIMGTARSPIEMVSNTCAGVSSLLIQSSH